MFRSEHSSGYDRLLFRHLIDTVLDKYGTKNWPLLIERVVFSYISLMIFPFPYFT